MAALTSDGLIRGDRYRVDFDDCCARGSFTGTFLGLSEDRLTVRFDVGELADTGVVSFHPVRDLPLPDQVLMQVENLDTEYDETRNHRAVVDDVELANVVTSLVAGPGGKPVEPAQHRPVLDLDMPVHVLPSSTPGHSHLYIDRELDWRVYRNLLDALVQAGLLERGYAEASGERRHTAVRLPWVRKGDEEDDEQLATPTTPAGPPPATGPIPDPVTDPWELPAGF